MNTLLLWILGLLGVLFLLLGLTRLQKGGWAWVGFGGLLALLSLGGAWFYPQYGLLVFWGLGLLGVLLLVWALLNLRRGRLAAWTAMLAVLLGLGGFGSIALLNSASPNLLTSGNIPDPFAGLRPAPEPSEEASPAPAMPEATPAQPEEPAPTPPASEATSPAPAPTTPEPSPPTALPEPSPAPPAPVLPTTSGSVREVEPACPCTLNVRVNAPNPTVRIRQGTQEVAMSRLERSSFLLEAGDYTLEVEAPGYRPFSALINVPKNKNLEVELVP
ncbi:PEGA domain-containing protein [Meiothermus rufus]|uniref:PEGA domain-containing protein n=1 Tax=Meiothermus rufus TaxID=604332 RepID=UPI000422D40E|nr:PEGA domain-containing protein [Meiothermus rufus]